MNEGVNILIRGRSLPEHRATITQIRPLSLTTEELIEAIVDLNAAVARLIDLHVHTTGLRRSAADEGAL